MDARPSIRKLPGEALRQLDRTIQDGGGPTECRELLQSERWKGVQVPSLPTMSRFVRERRSLLAKQVELLDRNEAALSEWDSLRGLQDDLPEVALKRLTAFLSNSATELRQASRGTGDPRSEKLVIEASQALKGMVEAQIEIDQRVDAIPEKVNLWVQMILGTLSHAVSKAYKGVHGDLRHGEFVAKLEAELDNLDYTALEARLTRVYRGDFKSNRSGRGPSDAEEVRLFPV